MDDKKGKSLNWADFQALGNPDNAPEELKEKGRTASWSKVKTAGKAFLDKSALLKQGTQKHKKKSRFKTQNSSNL